MYLIVHEVTRTDFTVEELKKQYRCDTVLRSGDRDYLARIIPNAEFEMVTSKSSGE